MIDNYSGIRGYRTLTIGVGSKELKTQNYMNSGAGARAGLEPHGRNTSTFIGIFENLGEMSPKCMEIQGNKLKIVLKSSKILKILEN